MYTGGCDRCALLTPGLRREGLSAQRRRNLLKEEKLTERGFPQGLYPRFRRLGLFLTVIASQGPEPPFNGGSPLCYSRIVKERDRTFFSPTPAPGPCSDINLSLLIPALHGEKRGLPGSITVRLVPFLGSWVGVPYVTDITLLCKRRGPLHIPSFLVHRCFL